MLKKNVKSVPKMLIAGIAGVGKTTFEKKLVGGAYDHKYQVITLDFTDEFINWTTSHDGQVFDAKDLRTNEIDMSKQAIDFSLNTLEPKPEHLANEIISLFDLIMHHAKKTDQMICLNIPEAEWYFSPKFSDKLRVLNTFVSLLHVLDYHNDTALMVIPMVSTAFKASKSKDYRNSVMAVLNEFRLYSLFNLPSFDTKVVKKIVGRSFTDDTAKKINDLSPYKAVTVKNPLYNSSDEEKSLGLIAKLVAGDMEKVGADGMSADQAENIYRKVLCLRTDIISGKFGKKPFNPEHIKASYQHILKNHHWEDA